MLLTDDILLYPFVSAYSRTLLCVLAPSRAQSFTNGAPLPHFAIEHYDSHSSLHCPSFLLFPRLFFLLETRALLEEINKTAAKTRGPYAHNVWGRVFSHFLLAFLNLG